MYNENNSIDSCKDVNKKVKKRHQYRKGGWIELNYSPNPLMWWNNLLVIFGGEIGETESVLLQFVMNTTCTQKEIRMWAKNRKCLCKFHKIYSNNKIYIYVTEF